MNKDKLTDRRENNIENKKEDYKDSNGNPEEFIEDMTDPEATDIFKEAFYAEGKALEEEALRSPFVEDEEKKEELRLRILESVGRSEDGAKVEKVAPETKAMVGEKTAPENKAMAGENVDLKAETRSAYAFSMKKQAENTATTVDAQNTLTENVSRGAVNASVAPVKKKKRKFTPLVRWVAVFALVCVGVFSVSMTSQAKGNGLWRSIQWLIGGETRWENDNNGEDRTYTNPEEEKAIGEIEKTLGIKVPKFFYWPGELSYKDMEFFKDSNSFMMSYSDGEHTVFFEGWKGENDTSTNNVWQGEGKKWSEKYDGVLYNIINVENDGYGTMYYVRWENEENQYSLSGMIDLEKLEKILKNIKN